VTSPDLRGARFASTGCPRRGGSGDNPVVRWEAPGEVEEYRIIRPLGAGSMGIVFLAHDTLLDPAVAMSSSALLLEARTRRLGMPILVSEAVAVALPPARRAALTPLGEVALRRSAPPMAVFGVAG
jgi:serine/threonine protein kinase